MKLLLCLSRSSLCWGRRTARWHFFMSTITQSCPSPGGSEFDLRQVWFFSCPFSTFSHDVTWISWPFVTNYSWPAPYFQVVWEPSTPFWTVSSMLSCTRTTVWLPWAPTIRSTCGGRNISQPFSWYVKLPAARLLFMFWKSLNKAPWWKLVIGIDPSLLCCSPDPVCYGDHPHLPVFLHEGLPLPVPHLHLHHRLVRPDFPVPLPQLLVPRLHQGQEAA